LRTRKRLLTVSGIAAAALAAAGLNTSAFAATTLSSGHVDVLDSEWDGSALHLHGHDEVTDTEYEPADVTLAVPVAAKIANPGYAFLGTGSQVWLLPDTEAEATAAGVLFAGVSTEHLTTGTFTGNTVTYTLVNATRNGASTEDFSVYSDASGSVNRYFDSGSTANRSESFTVGAHNHPNWAFEEAGTYQVTFTVSGTVGGGTVTSERETLTFVVSG
jgi:surface-anchored protein